MVPKFRGKTIKGLLVVGYVSVVTDKRAGVEPGTYISNSVGLPFAYEVDPKTVGQSTGLKDKNGVEIFEGDILVNQYGNVGYVAYLQQEAGFVVVKKKNDYRLGHRTTGESYDVSNNHEIIGNFWENPNLLEQANEN